MYEMFYFSDHSCNSSFLNGLVKTESELLNQLRLAGEDKH